MGRAWLLRAGQGQRLGRRVWTVLGAWNEAAQQVPWAVDKSQPDPGRNLSTPPVRSPRAGRVGGRSCGGWRGPTPSRWPSVPGSLTLVRRRQGPPQPVPPFPVTEVVGARGRALACLGGLFQKLLCCLSFPCRPQSPAAELSPSLSGREADTEHCPARKARGQASPLLFPRSGSLFANVP